MQVEAYLVWVQLLPVLNIHCNFPLISFVICHFRLSKGHLFQIAILVITDDLHTELYSLFTCVYKYPVRKTILSAK